MGRLKTDLILVSSQETWNVEKETHSSWLLILSPLSSVTKKQKIIAAMLVFFKFYFSFISVVQFDISITLFFFYSVVCWALLWSRVRRFLVLNGILMMALCTWLNLLIIFGLLLLSMRRNLEMCLEKYLTFYLVYRKLMMKNSRYVIIKFVITLSTSH